MKGHSKVKGHGKVNLLIHGYDCNSNDQKSNYIALYLDATSSNCRVAPWCKVRHTTKVQTLHSSVPWSRAQECKGEHGKTSKSVPALWGSCMPSAFCLVMHYMSILSKQLQLHDMIPMNKLDKYWQTLMITEYRSCTIIFVYKLCLLTLLKLTLPN